MFLLIILAGLGIIGALAAAIVARDDARGRVPEVWDYDTRRPIL